MTNRDSNGRFVKGTSGNPNGRPRKRTEEQYLHATVNNVTLKEWGTIVKRAVHDANMGDAQARRFLADYLLGKPPQRQEITGSEGGPVRVEYVNDWRNADD